MGVDTSLEGTRGEAAGAEAANVGAKTCVGAGVDKYNRGPESGRKLFRGFSA